MDEGQITIILIIFMLAGNILWYSAKFFIRNNGGESNLFWRHFRDFRELKKITSSEYPTKVKIEAKVYLYGIPIVALAIFIIIFSIIGGVV